MKTLYVRIVAFFILITICSALISLLIANAYYTHKLRYYNEQEAIQIGLTIRDLYERSPGLKFDDYVTHIADIGFQIYAVNEQMEGVMYGAPFRHTEFDEANIKHVLSGGSYAGMLKQKGFLPILGYFENSLRNTTGLPVQVDGQTYALFVRANLEQQIGEVRILLGLLMGFAFLISIVLIIILTRYIVKPLKELKAATHKIASGNYSLKLDMKRKDEFGELAQDFATMAQSIKRLDDMRQEFVANVSHEFQTPITSIQGFSQAIIAGKMSDEEKQRYLHIIYEESKRLSSLSKQLLTLAALDNEMQTAQFSSFRLDEQIRQILISLEQQWTNKELTIELHLPEIVIQADEQLLYHVWFNLISNSIKFCRNADHIDIHVNAGKELVVTVTDTGPGISEDELPYIFDRFYKEDKARGRNKPSGSGLGLSIARKIVELHSGSITVQSIPNQKTTFTVKLPFW